MRPPWLSSNTLTKSSQIGSRPPIWPPTLLLLTHFFNLASQLDMAAPPFVLDATRGFCHKLVSMNVASPVCDLFPFRPARALVPLSLVAGNAVRQARRTRDGFYALFWPLRSVSCYGHLSWIVDQIWWVGEVGIPGVKARCAAVRLDLRNAVPLRTCGLSLRARYLSYFGGNMKQHNRIRI